VTTNKLILAAIILAASACESMAQVPQLWKQKTGDATKITPTGGTPYKVELPNQLISTLATGTAPFAVSSTTAVTNLSIGGNAATATALAIGRTINGTTFDGTANVTVTSAAGTLTGATLASNVLASSLTSVGTLSGLAVTSANTTQVTTASALVINANSLTTGTGFYSASSTLTSGNLVDIQVSGTAAAASQTALNILTAGATATNAITTYGAQISNTHTNATSGTNVGLYLNASGATTANYGLIVANGNVGIGTTTPADSLSIVRSQNSGTRFNISNNTAGTGAFSQYTVLASGCALNAYALNSSYTTSGRYIAASGIIECDGTAGLSLSAASGTGILRFFTNGGNERMRIDPAGSVGIGMTPARKLDVTGTFGATGIATFGAPITIKGYTVATLPAGVVGYVAYVTDALAPAYGVAVAGGGAVVTPVFYNGAAWTCR
jgi:preprotein translocase subunit Sec61beta